ncbi:MAG TPA: hypothetical protein VFK23_03145, partial [Nitrospirota bacterium]|nr:hypothetical protein [Nitrospirota bacterium]
NDLVGSTDKALYEFKGGHVGVFVGTKSQKELAPAISQWLHERSGNGAKKPEPPVQDSPRVKGAVRKKAAGKEKGHSE